MTDIWKKIEKILLIIFKEIKKKFFKNREQLLKQIF